MKSRGFTLIELLVVISIIGLLSSVILAVTSDARYSANLVKTFQIVNEYKTALDSFYQDHGYYPLPEGGVGSNWSLGNHVSTYYGSPVNPSPLFNAQLSPYMSSFPEANTGHWPIWGADMEGIFAFCQAADNSNRCQIIDINWPQQGTKCKYGKKSTVASAVVNIVCMVQVGSEDTLPQ